MALNAPTFARGINGPVDPDISETGEKNYQWAPKVEAFFAVLAARANGEGINDDGTLAADPGGLTGLPAENDALNVALWKLVGQINATPANIKWIGPWDATTNTPDLTVAADQGETTGDGDWVGYAYWVTVGGTQDLGDGSRDFGVGDSIHFAALNTVRHADNSPNFVSDPPPQATDATGDAGTAATVMRSDARAPLDVTPELITTATTITLDPATGSGLQRLFVLDASGPVLTIEPTPGEQINGEVDLAKVYDTGNSQITAIDVAAGEWNVGPNTVTIDGPGYDVLYDGVWGTNRALADGLSWPDVRDRYQAITLNLNFANSAASFPGYISTDDIDFSGKTWRFGQDDAERAAFTIGNINGTAFDAQSTSLTSPNRVVIRGIPKERSFQPGAMVAEKGVVELVNGGSTSRTNSFSYDMGFTPEQLAEEFDLIVMSARDMGWDNKVVAVTVPAASLLDGSGGEVRLSDLTSGTARYIMWADFGAGSTTMQLEQDTSSGSRTFSHFRMLGIRKQFNAIRAEDAKLSTDFVDTANYTGSANNATTQGMYRNDSASLSGAPRTNFVWNLDVDVFGDQIKQIFCPMDGGTDVLGYWVRRSFDGGATWTAWAGR